MADTFTPPDNVAQNAQRALDVRAEKPPSQRGMTPVGLARANQLAQRRPVSLDTARRMVAYFERHEVDKEGATWDEQGRGWQAWMGWGGDEGRAWAKRIVERAEAMNETKSMQMMIAVDDEGVYTIQPSEGDAMTVSDPKELIAMLSEMLGIAMQDDAPAEEMPKADDMPAEDVAKVELSAAQRDELPDNDFAVPQTRNFPVVTPADISDAVSSWGRYEGDVSFETFKRNLIAIAKRKGPDFVDALPEAWKEEMDSAVKAMARKILGIA